MNSLLIARVFSVRRCVGFVWFSAKKGRITVAPESNRGRTKKARVQRSKNKHATIKRTERKVKNWIHRYHSNALDYKKIEKIKEKTIKKEVKIPVFCGNQRFMSFWKSFSTNEIKNLYKNCCCFLFFSLLIHLLIAQICALHFLRVSSIYFLHMFPFLSLSFFSFLIFRRSVYLFFSFLFLLLKEENKLYLLHKESVTFSLFSVHLLQIYIYR